MSDPMNERYFHDLVDSTGAALVTADAALRICYLNDAAARLFDRPVDELLEQPVARIVSEDQCERVEQLVRQTLERQEVGRAELSVAAGQGRERRIALTVSPILRPDGGCNGVSICAMEAAPQAVTERAWGDTAKMAALRTMAGGVAHHFNNLLGGLVTSIDFAQQSDDPRMLQRTLANASEALGRGNELTRRLLAFAEGDRIGGPAESVTEALNTFLDALRSGLAQRGIQLETAIAPTEVRLPVRSLITILEGLVANAIEAMSQGGTLRVELATADEGKHLILQVSDTGRGIDREQLSRVCEPFFTTKGGGRTGDPTHVGLGLAVVYGIVSGLRGSLTFDCPPEGGTRCSVRIPLPWVGEA